MITHSKPQNWTKVEHEMVSYAMAQRKGLRESLKAAEKKFGRLTKRVVDSITKRIDRRHAWA